MEARSGNGVGGPRARTGGHFLYRLQHTQPSQQLFVLTWCEESAWSISLLIHRVLQWILTIPIYSSSLRGPVTYTINTHNTKKSVLQYAERWEECRAGEDRWWERRNAAQCATQTAASWRGHGTGGERTERTRTVTGPLLDFLYALVRPYDYITTPSLDQCLRYAVQLVTTVRGGSLVRPRFFPRV